MKDYIKALVYEWLDEDLASKYIEILSKEPDDRYTEKHHILPESLFPEYSKNKDNLVVLSIIDHLNAHELLAKTDSHEMKLAFNMMFMAFDRRYSNLSDQEQPIVKSKLVEARKEMAKAKSEWGKTRVGHLNGFYGKKHTEEFKEFIRKQNKGQVMPESRNKKISKAKKGIPKPLETCPHCSMQVKQHAKNRRHNHNCRFQGVSNVWRFL